MLALVRPAEKLTVEAVGVAVRSAGSALLLEWAGQGGGAHSLGAEVPDPYTGTQEDFRRVWRMVDDAAERIVQRLAAPSRSARPAAIDS